MHIYIYTGPLQRPLKGQFKGAFEEAAKMCEDLTATVLAETGQGQARGEDACKVSVGNLSKGVTGKLSKSVTDDELADAFLHIGKIEFARVNVDQATGQSRGFGFVNFFTEE